MKKVLIAVLIAVVALGAFVGVAAARSDQSQMGLLHEYMEKALAEKLGIPLATVEAQFDAGKTLYQIALDNGVEQADIFTFMQTVRKAALTAAVADGVVTQTQANWMIQRMNGRGGGMMRNGTGAGTCGGMRLNVGSGGYRGGR